MPPSQTPAEPDPSVAAQPAAPLPFGASASDVAADDAAGPDQDAPRQAPIVGSGLDAPAEVSTDSGPDPVLVPDPVPEPAADPESAPTDSRPAGEVDEAAALWRAFIDEADDEPVDEQAQAAQAAALEERLARHDVTAILVSHDGARWLRFCLAALADLDRAPRRVVAVDTGSSDASCDLLAESLGAASVLHRPVGAGFGEALAHAVSALEGAPGLPSGATEGPVVEWLWLLHDDCAPEPDALRALLTEAERTPAAAVIGPKVRGWKDGRLLLELGLTVGRSGRRETDLERGETDQGQHDDRHDTFAVGSAGMLIRRDVWDALGGFAEDLPLFRDDVDFCWRARRAGYQVVVAPGAVVHHAEAAAHGRRSPGVPVVSMAAADRRSAMLLLLGNLPARALPWTYVRLIAGSLLRSLVLLLGKDAKDAWSELVAVAAVVGRPDRVLKARRRRSRPATEPWSALRPYLAPSGAHLRRGLEATLGALGNRGPSTNPGGLESGPSEEDTDSMVAAGSGALSRWASRPSVALGGALILLSLLTWRGLLFGGALQGGALLPAPAGAADLWGLYLEPWHTVGVGSSAPTPPWVAALAVPSWLTLGDPGALLSLLFLLAVPAAGLSAYLVLRRLTTSRGLRWWGAAAYALLPGVTGAVAAGRVGTVVVACLLPLLVLALARLTPRPERSPSWRGVAATGLLLALASAFVPIIWVAVAAAILTTGFVGRAAREWWIKATALLAVAILVLLPWSWSVVAHPATVLLEAGAQGAGLADPELSPWALVAASPGGPGVPTWWLTGGVLVAGLAALLGGRRRRLVAIAWGGALIGLALGLVTVVVRVQVPSLDAAVTPWPGVATLMVGGGMIAAAVIGAEGLRTSLARETFGWRQPAAVLVVVVALVTPLVTGAAWLSRGAGGPLDRQSAQILPAFVVAASASESQPSTLLLSTSEGAPVTYALLRGSGLTLGEADVAPAASAAGPLDALVEDLASGRAGDDVAARLSTYGTGYVLVPSPADPGLAEALDTVPGLERLAATDGSALWGVAGTAARLRAQSADGSAVVLPSGPVDGTADLGVAAPAGAADAVEPRVLALADAPDARWRASLDGVALSALPIGEPVAVEPPVPAYAGPSATWAQRFALPTAGGTIEVSYDGSARTRWLVVEAAVLLAAVVIALPGRRRELDEGDDDPDGAGDQPATRLSNQSAHEPAQTAGVAGVPA